ncbi:hypothetical protein EV702DRAFT_1042428 [Suillus placidus]|uniref:XPG-I domain-containing protein n=1 Tax=Suillus placidus TaxID=48579 RepID=A0A9P7A2Z6_9AGAM|nr:hypothetical protein EV702DRAFT_1042428 [Suillus placidus]
MQAVAPAGEKHSLLEYATAQKHNVSTNDRRGTDKLRLGVDANEVIIIFDGPAKPAIKRGTHVMKTPPWLTEPFKHFALTLGFAIHDVAGEAEAELAALNRNGVIDAVITEDSDALVMLSDGGLLLMALLCGGDYHDGLPGCGWKTARGLAQYGVGDDLLQEAQAHSLTSSHDGLKDYICGWVCRLRKILVKNPLGHIGRRHPRFLNNFPNNFPELSVVLAYVKPQTSVQPVNHNSCSSVNSKVLDLENLTYLCPVRDAESMGTMRKLQDYIWPGICIHVLLETQPESIIRIHSEQKALSSHTLKQYRIKVKSCSLITAAKKGVMQVQHMVDWTPAESAAIVDSITNSQPDLLESTSRVWVPAPLVEDHFPALVHAFTTKVSKRRRPGISSSTASTATASCDYRSMEVIELTDSDGDTASYQRASHNPKRRRHAFDAYALEILDLTDSD